MSITPAEYEQIALTYLQSLGIDPGQEAVNRRTLVVVEEVVFVLLANWLVELSKQSGGREDFVERLGEFGQVLLKRMYKQDETPLLYALYQVLERPMWEDMFKLGLVTIRYADWQCVKAGAVMDEVSLNNSIRMVVRLAFRRQKINDNWPEFLEMLTPDNFLQALWYELQEQSAGLGMNLYQMLEEPNGQENEV